jgi:hypothetical protein
MTPESLRNTLQLVEINLASLRRLDVLPPPPQMVAYLREEIRRLSQLSADLMVPSDT